MSERVRSFDGACDVFSLSAPVVATPRSFVVVLANARNHFFLLSLARDDAPPELARSKLALDLLSDAFLPSPLCN